MGFLSATLLLGTLAAGVPVALHLLARQPPRRVVFPAVAFLRQRLTTQTSRLRVRRLWLLALRVLALVAFAIVLARPHIDTAMSSQWVTTGALLLAGAGVLVLASVAFSRGLSRSLCWVLLISAVLLGAIGGGAAVRAIASGARPQVLGSRPMAIAIVIDNSPSSAWRIDDDLATAASEDGSEDNSDDPQSSEELREQSGLDLEGTRLSVALRRASELIESLPGGSRVAIVDRSASPAGFSLDQRAAHARLDRVTPHAVPQPIAQRIVAAVELVRTSDLPERQVVVISDMAAASWDEHVPTSSGRSPVAVDQHDDVPISILNIHEHAVFDTRVHPDDTPVGVGRSAKANEATVNASTINPWISPPQVAEAAPSPGAAISIRFDVGVWNANAAARAAGADASGAVDGRPQPFTATVQLRLYDHDPSLPVVRDGKIVRPSLRTVDRASLEVGNVAGQEVSLTLPPLTRGTHHAVVELMGRDRFAWDNRRFLTVELPEPPRTLIVGEDRDETSLMAAALTAPHAPDDPSASYEIETVSYHDLGAVDWNQFHLVVLIDPPLRFHAPEQTIVGSSGGISSAMWADIAGVVSRGGGLVIGLGPAAEVIEVGGGGRERVSGVSQAAGVPPVNGLVPPLVRTWRIPPPGTFWYVTAVSHPIFSALMRPTSMPNWSDFRIHRYWQVADPAAEADASERAAVAPSTAWAVIARYARNEEAPGQGHPAVLTRLLGEGRIALTTTPLPALGPKTRSWNDLLSASDAWPAFMTVRGLAAWAAGVDHGDTTISAGQTAVLPLELTAATNIVPSSQASPREALDAGLADTALPETVLAQTGLADAGLAVELYTPGQASGRSLAVTQSRVVVDDTDTPGTYFVRGPKVWSGVSVNLAPIWSDGQTTQLDTLQKWFGDEGWSIANDLSELSLQPGGRAGAAVSLHGPLMLIAVLVFLAEQVLSNRFYGSSPAPEPE